MTNSGDSVSIASPDKPEPIGKAITTKWAPLKKTIYSLPALQETLRAANQLYIKLISSIVTP